MVIAVIGAGALGSVYAGLLAARLEDDDVWVATRRLDQAESIRERGLAVEMAAAGKGEPPQAVVGRPLVMQPPDIAGVPPIDAAIVLIKSYDMDYAADLVGKILAPDGIAVTLLNGLGNYEKLVAAIGPDRAVAGTTNVNGKWLGLGRTSWSNSPSGVTAMGYTSKSETKVRELASKLQSAELQAEVSDNLDAVIWTKMALAVSGPVSALVPATVLTLAKSPAARDVMERLTREIVAVAIAKGVDLDSDEIVARLRAGWDPGRGDRVPSMLEDALNGRPTEIEARCGAIVTEGRAVGVATPANELMYRLVTALDETRDHRFVKRVD
jgi:2-dehydropantoate 2-reductase